MEKVIAQLQRGREGRSGDREGMCEIAVGDGEDLAARSAGEGRG